MMDSAIDHRSLAEGWHIITPRIVAQGTKRFVEFLVQVFGATGEFQDTRPSVLWIGDSPIMVSEAGVRTRMPTFLYCMKPQTPFVSRLFTFIGGAVGPWRVENIRGIVGESIASPSRLSVILVIPGLLPELPCGSLWTLRGITNNERYVVREENVALVSKQEGLGRAASKRAALIPIRKNAAWWSLT